MELPAALDDHPLQHQQQHGEQVQPRAATEEPTPSSPISPSKKRRVNVPLQSKSSIKKSSKKSKNMKKKNKKKKSKERAEEEAEMTVRFALNQTELRENLEQPNPPKKEKRLHAPLFPGWALPREITLSRYLVRRA